MAFKAKYSSTCKTCNQLISIGDDISWARRGENKGTHHAACYTPQQTKPTNEPAQTTTKPAPIMGGTLAETLAKEIQPYLDLQLDSMTDELETKFTELIHDALSTMPKPETKVYIQQGKTLGTVTSKQHEHFDLLLQLIANNHTVYLWGEAGSGKSSAAAIIAELLGRPFYYLALQAQMSEWRLMGYMDANGTYVESDFYKAYKHGGIFLLDELELGNGNLLGSLNGALANGRASFPCGIVERHPDFVCIATGNTPGIGASVTYSDRRPLDGAVRDRFVYVQWDTDTTLEKHLAAAHFGQSDKWVTWVQKVRQLAKVSYQKMVVSQRASIEGSKLLALGLDVSRVAEMVVFRGIDEAARKSILSSYPLPIF